MPQSWLIIISQEESSAGVVVRAVASDRCGLGLISRHCVICMWVEFVGSLLCSVRFSISVLQFSPLLKNLHFLGGAVVAQLASVRLLELEVPSSILGELNICFDFPLICVAIAVNTRKKEL